ncbi:hypothetical protein HHL10_10760 [Azohydromonas sp. G-1-1-14]|uniref:Uncharacterized protein n=2 Tax=Azohydromonas caseinilytica TaxID=2728836 RepID=A0A848F5W2_9BURK|nr:hypothetical protein [Azohydromonas caseinilytica]
MLVAWPSFLMAAVLEMLVFALVDPHSLQGAGGVFSELSATTVYSLAFFLFWAAIAAAGALEHWLAAPADGPRSRAMPDAHGH